MNLPLARAIIAARRKVPVMAVDNVVANIRGKKENLHYVEGSIKVRNSNLAKDVSGEISKIAVFGSVEQKDMRRLSSISCPAEENVRFNGMAVTCG